MYGGDTSVDEDNVSIYGISIYGISIYGISIYGDEFISLRQDGHACIAPMIPAMSVSRVKKRKKEGTSNKFPPDYHQ